MILGIGSALFLKIFYEEKKQKLPMKIHLIPGYKDEFSFKYQIKEIEDLVAEIILLGSGEPDEQMVRPLHTTDQGEQQTHQK